MSRRDFIAGYMAAQKSARKKTASGLTKVMDVNVGGDIVEIWQTNDEVYTFDPFDEDEGYAIGLVATYNSICLPNFSNWMNKGDNLQQMMKSLNAYSSVNELCEINYGGTWQRFMVEDPKTTFDY